MYIYICIYIYIYIYIYIHIQIQTYEYDYLFSSTQICIHLFIMTIKQAQRLAGGTGLGLFSLSKRTEALGGSRGVSVRKDGRRGSNFWFSFPYRPDFSPDPNSPMNAANKNQAQPQNGITTVTENDLAATNLHVLLIDDSITIIQVIGRVLRNKGFTVTTANNGSAGLDCLIQGFTTKKFDFVLMDLQMPVMVSIYSYFSKNMLISFNSPL
jgi:hypothetical protein